MKIKVKRTYYERETLGNAELQDETGKIIFLFKVLELPNLNNHIQTSCIPEGTYNVRKVGGSGNIPYPHLAVDNVPGRAGICIHIGNYATGKQVDSAGCLLTGSAFTDINKDGQLDIIESGKTFHALLTYINSTDKLTLEITS